MKAMAMNRPSVFLIIFILLPATHLYGQVQPTEGLPTLVSALQQITALEFCEEKVPLEIQEVRERLEKELLLALGDRPQAILWLKRSRRYLPHIQKVLRENGLPTDLQYVAIAESALRPHAGSHKGAMGFWQFMAHTGRKYGLVVNDYIDQRRNLFASTQAAVRYFKDLYLEFGSWSAAVAAFNMGEEGLLAEILAQEINDYYRLYLPLETQRFIFRILAVKLIFENSDAYGFKLSNRDYYLAPSYDRVQIMCFQEIPLRIIAQAAHTHFKVIKDLNPEIRGHYLTAGTHSILVPQGAADGFQQRYPALVEAYAADRKQRVYIVQKGDNLSSIATRFDIPLAALIIWNRIDLRQSIHPGQRLIIYSKKGIP